MLRGTKGLMKGPLARAVPERMDEEGAVFGRTLVAAAAREAFTAFFAKRRPDFSRFA